MRKEERKKKELSNCNCIIIKNCRTILVKIHADFMNIEYISFMW